MLTEEDFSSQLESTAVYWGDLSRTTGIRLPMWKMPMTTGGMRRFLRKIGKDPTWYFGHTNEKTLGEFAKKNPEWPLRAWAGICLEWYWYERTADARAAEDAERAETQIVKRKRSPRKKSNPSGEAGT